MDGFIAKPFDVERAVALIRQLAGREALPGVAMAEVRAGADAANGSEDAVARGCTESA